MYMHTGKMFPAAFEVLEARDKYLYGALFNSIQLGLIHDQIWRMKMDDVSVVSGRFTFHILESIKKSTINRDYSILK